MSPTLELGVRFLLPTIRLAWTEDILAGADQIKSQDRFLNRLHSHDFYQTSAARPARDQALKYARNIFILGFGITIAMIILMNYGGMGYLRPHVSGVFVAVLFGIVTPLTVIMSNAKMRKFLKELFLRNIWSYSVF